MLTQWIIRRIPDYENVKDERVRSAYGKAASLVGIGCNVLLFAGKLFAGLLSGSVAIMADAVNNLSDVSSSLTVCWASSWPTGRRRGASLRSRPV